MLRLNHSADATIAEIVMVADTTVRNTTNVPSDCENSSQIVIDAFAVCTNAHSSEIWRKKRRTWAFACISFGSGQKSAASRPASGRSRGTDNKNAAATSIVASDGCKK